MKNSKFQTLVYSTAGVALVFIAVVGANLIFSPVRARVDLTADGLHTLSDGTRAILAKLDAPIQVRLYVSQGKDRMPSAIQPYVQRVEDLLAEFKAQAKGNLEIKKFDPEPDSETEDSAKLDGIEPVNLQQMSGGPFYLGLAVEYAPQRVAIPFLSPQREKLLEYDLARAVTQVLATNKPVIGIMSPLQVMGGFNPMAMQAMQMGRQPQQSEPWIFVNELKRDFEVQTVGMDAEQIDENVKVLVVLHPKDISPKAEFAIDQFVLRGGKVIAFLDALCLADNRNPNPMGFNLGGGSTFPKLLNNWGYDFDTSKVVSDTDYMRQLQGRDGRPQLVPSFLFLNSKAINKDDPVTGQLDDIWLPFAGAFTGKAADGLKADVLFYSSKNSQLTDGVTSQLNGGKVVDDFKPSGIEYNLGLRLTGKFKTSFPDGNPSDTNHVAGATNAPAGDFLKESKTESAVYLIGDADLMSDQFSVRVDQMFRTAYPLNGNLTFMQNLIEQATGDANLMEVRSRASLRRAFTVVQEMESKARIAYQAKIESLDKRLQDLQSKLNDFQIKKEGNVAKIILSPEQQQALKQVNEEQANTRKELRKERRNLRLDVEALENWLKWGNILGMPIVVAAVGVGLAIIRYKRTSAR
jgi:ABC-type uncharacterized transport system involved in gliding motility auxiliary subunit